MCLRFRSHTDRLGFSCTGAGSYEGNDRGLFVCDLHGSGWIQSKQMPKQILHHLGMLPKRSRRTIDPDSYKIVIFDVESDSLCRSIELSDDSSVTSIDRVGGLYRACQTGEASILDMDTQAADIRRTHSLK